MADFDSADLLKRVKRVLGFTGNTAIGDTTLGTLDERLYECLTNAQRRIVGIFAAAAPHSQVSAPEQLPTGDSGLTYTFAYYPWGHVELRDGRDGPLVYPANDWDQSGQGMVIEGQTLRVPNGETRTYADGLWARYVREPGVISAAVEPTLLPPSARICVVYAAAEEYASQGGAMNPDPYITALAKAMRGDPQINGDVGFVGRLQAQFHMMGAPAAMPYPSYWWRNPDFT